MKIKTNHLQSTVTQLQCDRCNRQADIGEPEFFEFTSIDYKAGYGSVLGDGNQVEIDLCQHCLKETLGPWLRVTEESTIDETLAHALKQFDPAKHGGEFPSNEA